MGALKMQENLTIEKDYRRLILLRAGMKTTFAGLKGAKALKEAEKEQRWAKKKIDELIKSATDSELEKLARDTARNEALQGWDYKSEYNQHLRFLKDKRTVLQGMKK